MSEDLLGIPYHQLNCWELVCEKLHALGYQPEHLVHPDQSVVEAATAQPMALDHLIPPGWSAVGEGEEQVGDVVALGHAGACTHFGVVDMPGWVLHTTALRGSHLSRMRDLRRGKCVHSIWRIARC